MKKSSRIQTRLLCLLLFAGSLSTVVLHALPLTAATPAVLPEETAATQEDTLTAPLPPKYVFHCEKDTLEIEKLLKENPQWASMPMGERLTAIARKLAMRPEAESTYLNTDTVGSVEIDIHAFDPLGFVNTVWALSNTVRRGASTWQAYAQEYELSSRRNGEADGFLSRFLFPSEWLTDHLFRGDIQELTGNYSQILHQRDKTVDFMSHNREDYAALTDSATFEAVKRREMAYMQYPLKYLANNSFTKTAVKKGLEEGDLVILYSTERDVDSTDLAFVTFEDGVPFLIHLSPGEGKIWRETLPIDKYVTRNVRRIAGARVFRLK